ncbi:hypothetical protein LMG1231_06199 [Achromobacter denitrificans]|nr:hypothetical protein LMG1231_06199 [Achromobacter denitrificans]
MRQGLGRVAAAQGHHARERQRLGLVRLGGQRLRHRADGGRVRRALAGGQQRVGQVGQHRGLAGHQPQHLLVGGHRVGVTPQGFIGARQHVPAVGIVRRGPQALGQRVDHERHVVARGTRVRFGGQGGGGAGRVGRRARVAQLPIKQHGGDRDQHAQQAGGRHAGALPGPGRGALAAQVQVLQQVALQLLFGARALGGAEAAVLQVALQLLALRQVEGAHIGAGGRLGRGRAAQQRRDQAEQGRQQQRQYDEPERGHEPVSRKRAARSRSSAVSGARAPARRRSVRSSTAKPSASRANGPSHSSQVMGLKGGS